MSYLPGFWKNVNDFRLHSNSCVFPDYCRLESLRALRPDPCPICSFSPDLFCEEIVSSYGDKITTLYIRCHFCGLSLRCEDYNSVKIWKIWNRLSFAEGGTE